MTTPVSLAIAGAIFVLLGIGLVYSAAGLVQGNREDVLGSAPVVTEQTVTIPVAGEVLVAIDTPRTEADFRGFQIQLTNRETGEIADLRYSYATAQGAIYGVSSMRVPFGRIAARPGAYAIRVTGILPGKDYSQYRVILSRPYMGRMVLQILGIAFCGIGMLGCIVWAAWLAGWMKPAQG